ncbi:hypothetical protein HMPREF9946_00518 [Acetobacteraceae bacterium AT-5844]|nr:hypothetical protein HMPREF9946_00518 [Acetobacteraceae bacterium AT-5844]
MKKILMLGAGIVMLGVGGVAMAQAPQPPAGAPPQAEAQAPRPEGRGPGERGPRHAGPGEHGPRHHGMRGPHRFGPPPSKAASFMIERGDTRIRIRCAENEPMQACVAAASALLDKASTTVQPR